jgi:hypothetical protein
VGAFRGGFNASYVISYGNYGTTTIAPTIVFFPDSNVNYLSASVVPSSASADSVVWILPALSPYETGSIVVSVNVNPGILIGSLINSSVRIDPVAGDANPACNYHAWEVFAIGSFDPNDILVSEDTLTTAELFSSPWLDYIIRFQNTGNDTAFNIKILNPVDTSRLNLASLEIVNASHPASLRWIPWENNIEVKFDNILLPDSIVNEPLSHGYFHYRIKPKTTLNAGDSILNYAAIYFDFNFPVLTNKAITMIVLATTAQNIAEEGQELFVYPNPATQTLTVSGIHLSSAEKAEIFIFDVFGNIVLHNAFRSNNSIIHLPNFSTGIYFLELYTPEKTYRARFMKD